MNGAAGTFVLGLGAQKAGTTWLHGYISAAAGTDTGPLKEYHVWDAVHLAECARFRVPLWQIPHPKARLRWRLQRSETAYLDHFAGLLARPGIRLTADITPSYAGLPAAVLARIAAGFAARGIAVRAVFLMRDPVQRCWSTIRMTRRLGRGEGAGGAPLDLDEQQALERYAFGEGAALRSRYDRTLEAIAAAFPEDAVHLGLYERMFEPGELARLSAFLGLPPDESFAARRFNVSEKTVEMPPDLMARIARHYRPAYEAVAARLPEARAHWPGFDHL